LRKMIVNCKSPATSPHCPDIFPHTPPPVLNRQTCSIIHKLILLRIWDLYFMNKRDRSTFIPDQMELSDVSHTLTAGIEICSSTSIMLWSLSQLTMVNLVPMHAKVINNSRSFRLLDQWMSPSWKTTLLDEFLNYFLERLNYGPFILSTNDPH
jgi:hypothetical protein